MSLNKFLQSVLCVLTGIVLLSGCGNESKKTAASSPYSQLRYQWTRQSLPPAKESELTPSEAPVLPRRETLKASKSLASGGTGPVVAGGDRLGTPVFRPPSSTALDPPSNSVSVSDSRSPVPPAVFGNSGFPLQASPPLAVSVPSQKDLAFISPAAHTEPPSLPQGNFAAAPLPFPSLGAAGGGVRSATNSAPSVSAGNGSTASVDAPDAGRSSVPQPDVNVANRTSNPVPSFSDSALVPRSGTAVPPVSGPVNGNPGSTGSGTGGLGLPNPLGGGGQAITPSGDSSGGSGDKIPILGQISTSPEGPGPVPQFQPFAPTVSGGIGGQTGRTILAGSDLGDEEPTAQIAFGENGTLGSLPPTQAMGDPLTFLMAQLTVTFDGYPLEDTFNAKVGVEYLPPATVSRLAIIGTEDGSPGTLSDELDPEWKNECEGRVVRFIALGTLPKGYDFVYRFLNNVRHDKASDLTKLSYADYVLDANCKLYPEKFPISYNGVMMYLMAPPGTPANPKIITVEKSDAEAWEAMMVWMGNYNTFACMRGSFITKTALVYDPEVFLDHSSARTNLVPYFKQEK